ncbi:MAG: carboxy terminal-processing peptidase [Gammaproteobacteria bacterium]|nr:carboxy terminal-processing peptidase [Gammaproteobacteria bacterium]
MTKHAYVRWLLGTVAAGALSAAGDPVTSASDYAALEPLDGHPQTSVAIVDRLRHYHMASKSLDDELSSQILDKYLSFLDPKRSHLLATDVSEFEKYRGQLDDALEQGDLAPAFEIYNRFHRRALERIEYDVATLQRGIEQFDFTVEEDVELDRSEAPWPADRAEVERLWHQSLKSRVLIGKLADESLETIADTLTKRVNNSLRAVRQTRSEDVFQTYINAFAQTYDEYTQYFSPRDSEDFNIAMSLSLEGIGAVLGRKDDYTIVQDLVKGGPADLGGDLKRTDRIVAVSQSRKEPFVDIVGWRTDEVVQLIRGPKDSPVLLKVFAAQGDAADTRVVEIVRNVVKLEDQAASKSSFTIERGGREHRIGVVVVPTFYMDFKALRAGDENYKSTTRDVARLIRELKDQDIDALIVDLRNNGGGSLQEARELTGLFVESGPVVQVADSSRPTVLSDRDGGAVTWRGPLAVIVNRYSASASEIFAGAIQDYGLGVVVGNQTFGKGTVQTLIPLPAGELKVTERRYYRVSGLGTERNGIVPDIVFPTRDGSVRRRAEVLGTIDDPMATVSAASYAPRNRVAPLLDALRIRHEERASTDPEFAYLRAREDYFGRLRERTHLSLREATRLAQQEADDAWILEVENARLIARGEQPLADLDELTARREAEAGAERPPEDDVLTRETAAILADFIDLSQPLAMAGGQAPAPRTLPTEPPATARADEG